MKTIEEWAVMKLDAKKMASEAEKRVNKFKAVVDKLMKGKEHESQRLNSKAVLSLLTR